MPTSDNPDAVRIVNLTFPAHITRGMSVFIKDHNLLYKGKPMSVHQACEITIRNFVEDYLEQKQNDKKTNESDDQV